MVTPQTLDLQLLVRVQSRKPDNDKEEVFLWADLIMQRFMTVR